MLPLAFTLPPQNVPLFAAIALAFAAAAALFRIRSLVLGTTLTAPWMWTCIALAALAAVELAVSFAENAGAAWIGPARFAAATLSYCPIMALLGAKRPQNKAWQLIVLSLWIILALPAAEVFFLRPGQTLVLRDLRAWFLWIPPVIELASYLPTRQRWSALAAVAGQVLLLGEHLPLVRWQPADLGPVLGIGLLSLAVLFALGAWRFAARAPVGWLLLWRDFRTAYGLLWPMQIAERFNAAAATQAWPVRLTWLGPIDSKGDPVNEMPLVASQHLQNLLRRLVSAAWIAERMPAAQAVAAPAGTSSSAP